MELQHRPPKNLFHKVADVQGCWPAVQPGEVTSSGSGAEGQGGKWQWEQRTDWGASRGRRECAGPGWSWPASVWGLVRFLHGGACGFRSIYEHRCAVLHHTCVRQFTHSVWWALEIFSLLLLLLLWTVFSVSFCEHPASFPEKAMASHSSTLAWKIPWTEEPGRLQSMGSLRVGHDWATSLSLFTFMHWRRKWQPTPEFLPGESQGRRSLVGCRLWGHTESDMTEVT